jgi:hypothetical protein
VFATLFFIEKHRHRSAVGDGSATSPAAVRSATKRIKVHRLRRKCDDGTSSAGDVRDIDIDLDFDPIGAGFDNVPFAGNNGRGGGYPQPPASEYSSEHTYMAPVVNANGGDDSESSRQHGSKDDDDAFENQASDV